MFEAINGQDPEFVLGGLASPPFQITILRLRLPPSLEHTTYCRTRQGGVKGCATTSLLRRIASASLKGWWEIRDQSLSNRVT